MGVSVDEYRKLGAEAYTLRHAGKAWAPSVMELSSKTCPAEDTIEQIMYDLIWTPTGESATIWVGRTFNKEGRENYA